MKVDFLVTGSSGFIGKHLIEKIGLINSSFKKVSHKDFASLTLNLSKLNANTIIHLAGRAHVLKETSVSSRYEYYKANCEYALNVARAAVQSGLKRFVYVSSIGVYGRSCSSTKISENFSLIPVEDYARSKLEAECELTKLSEELGFELVIVRPALVYGADAPGNIEKLLKLTLKLPVIPIAEKNNKRSFVYVENLVDFLLLVAEHPNAPGKAFNIADGAISTYDLIANFAKGMGRRPLLFSPHRSIWKLILGLAGKKKMYEQLFEDLVLDMSLAERELGWKPTHETVASLIVTGKQYKQTNSKMQSS